MPLSGHLYPNPVADLKPGHSPPPHLYRNHFGLTLYLSSAWFHFSTWPKSKFVFAVGCMWGNAGSLLCVAPLWFTVLPMETVFGFTFSHIDGNCVTVSAFSESACPPFSHSPLFFFQATSSILGCLKSLQAEFCLTIENKPWTIFMLGSQNRYRLWCISGLARIPVNPKVLALRIYIVSHKRDRDYISWTNIFLHRYI